MIHIAVELLKPLVQTRDVHVSRVKNFVVNVHINYMITFTRSTLKLEFTVGKLFLELAFLREINTYELQT